MSSMLILGREVWVGELCRTMPCVLKQTYHSHSASVPLPGEQIGSGEISEKPDELLGGITCDGLASHPG